MSKEFIEKKCNSLSLDKAVRQKKQLDYFTISEIQEDVNIDYFEKYVERKYHTDDVFLNWVKSIFKTDNFLSLAKYYRSPNPSSKLINTRIKEPLTRVFFSEDSHFKYWINGEYVENPKELEDGFDKDLFKAVLFRYNDIIVHDLEDTNKPYREIISIDKVVSIEVDGKRIEKISYTGMIERDGEDLYGYVYLDEYRLSFYNKDLELILSEPHDYGQCPATFIVDDCFDNDPIVKESIFSYLRADLEEYTFLKTLQRMTHANGAFPIVTQIETKEIDESGYDINVAEGQPMSLDSIGGQVSQEARATAGNGKGTKLQPGTVITVPAIEKADGSIDVELSKNFLTFYHTPVEALEYVNSRLLQLENDIITSCLGAYSERNDVSMTEMQTKKGIVSMEDKLRWFSKTMSFSRTASDKMMLSLKHGKGAVKLDIFYGSDFFLETQKDLYEMIKSSPNAIERKNLLVRLAQRRNMFNKEKATREAILYKIMPYTSDVDFDKALDKGMVDDTIMEFQTRFSYWISMFESFYGNIAVFWEGMDATDSEKLITLNNLIVSLINTHKNKITSTDGKEASNQPQNLQG
jgi:hypothetical protein